MADIRLKKITVEPLESPLLIQHGDVNITNTTVSDSMISGSIISNGSIAINSTHDSISSTAGGCLTVGGGVGIMKKLQVGGDCVLDSASGKLTIRGGSENRLYIDSITGKYMYFAPDGVNKVLEINEKNITINTTAISSNSTTGSLKVLGGISISTTENSSSSTSGGALTISGGVAVAKRVHVGDGITSISSNTLGNIFTNSGNVGIGVVSPNTALSIKSAELGPKITLFDGGSSSQHFGFGVGGEGLNYHVQNTYNNHIFYATGKNGNGTELMRIKGDGNVGIGTSTPLEKLDIDGKIRIQNGLMAEFNSNTVGSIFTTGGNVGIGNTQPLYKLDVVGNLNVKSNSESRISSATGGSYMYLKSIAINNTSGFVEIGSSINSDLILQSNSNTFVGIGTTQPKYNLDISGDLFVKNSLLSIGNSNTLGSLFTTGGNVGINNTSPDNRLDINGDTNIVGNLKINGLRISSDNNVNYIESGTQISNGSKADLSFGDVDKTEMWVTFSTSGNVGIGSTNPEYKLQVSDGDILITNGNLIATNNSNTVGSIITTNGNVGIGLSSPIANLDVNGTIHSNNTVILSHVSESLNSSSGTLVLLDGGISINKSTDATSVTQGGVLTIAGGASIAKKVFVGDTVYFKNPDNASISSGSIITDGGMYNKCETNSTSITNGGSMTIKGGMSVSKDVYIGGNIIGDTSLLLINKLTINSTEESINQTSGSIITSGGITVNCQTNSTSVTNGGSVTVSGGVSINKDLYVAGDSYLYSKSKYLNNGNLIEYYDGSNLIYSVNRVSSTKNLNISRYTNGNLKENSLEINYNDGHIILNNTDISSGYTSASLVVRGGVSIVTTEQATTLNNGGGFTLRGGASVNGNLLIGKNVVVYDSTESSDINSGAVIVNGGIGITKNLNVGGNTIINGSLTVNGETTSLITNNTVIKDNIIVLNAGPSGTKDSGFLIQRYQNDNNSSSGDVVNDNNSFDINLPSQSGMTSSEIKFDNTASSIDNYYVGWWVKIISGFSNSQVRKITNYVGSTKIATISTSWYVQNPTTGDTISLYNKPFIGLIYNEVEDRFEFGGTQQEPDSNNISFIENLPIVFSSAISNATQIAENPTTGSFVLSGGICIKNESDSQSLTNGGTFLTMGGASINKSLYVGNNLIVNGVNLKPNSGDVLSSKTFSANNNQSIFANITDLLFNSTIWGFDVYLCAQIISYDNLFCNFHIRGVNKGTSWELVKTYVGDDTGIEFDITESGQIQYTTPEYDGFVSCNFKWRVITNQ